MTDMKTVYIGHVAVAPGIPRVIVPIAGKTREEIVGKSREIAGISRELAQVAEWRADYYEDARQEAELLKTLTELRAALGEKALIFTFRTKKEGGNQEISPEVYAAMNIAAAESGLPDAVDVEIFAGDDPECRLAGRLIENIHRAGKIVIASSHDFQKTPPREELLRRFGKMLELQADILKMAMMPESLEDVMTLLQAAEEMSCRTDRPLIAVSMSSLGLQSRTRGELYGSAMTFGTAGDVTAPGQLPLPELYRELKQTHEYLQGKIKNETGI